MTFLSNLKWNATTIIAVLIIAIGAAIYVLSAIASWFIGTNPDGSKKTPTQVNQANNEAKVTAVK
jgi:nitric oxide synthase oxygenase domain/subunit